MSESSSGTGRRAEPALEPLVGDAFGATLLACYENGMTPWSAVEIVERDDGFIDSSDASRYFIQPDAFGALDRWACAKVGERVVDVGSGAGRASLYLQDLGRDVLALDVSPLAAEVCRRRGVENVFLGTLDDVARTGAGPFDSFLMLGNNLGLLGSPTEAVRLLATMAALAAPNAIIAAQGTDPYQTDNPVHHGYHSYNRSRRRMGGQLRIRVRRRELATDWFDYLFVTLDELAALLAPTRWRIEESQVDNAQYAVVLRLAG
jgi:SAM-dependent methyltransferase